MGRAKDRLGRVSKGLRTLPEEGVRFSNRQARAATLRTLREDAGADRTLSGLRHGVPQTVEVKSTSTNGGRQASGQVKAGPQRQRAPWFWLQEGTKPGRRAARSGRARGGGEHPGTPAKLTWSRGMAAVVPAVRKEFERLFSRSVG